MSFEELSSVGRLKKVNRKLRKFQHIVFKETGLSCTLEPKKNLVICNVGLVNGLSEDKIFEQFSEYGFLDNIILLPGKSCCILSYRDIQSAIRAFQNCNGKLNIAQDNKPVYLLFTDALPHTDHSSQTWDQLPQGLVIYENFISREEEDQLIKICNFSEVGSLSEMKHRQVKHYGYEFRYDTNNVDKDKPLNEEIPSNCKYIFDRLRNTPFSNFYPDQLTVNHYKPGQGIPPHVDTHSAFENPIIVLSLISAVVMEFRKGDRKLCVLLLPRSLGIFSGESRYDWTHCITPRKFDIIKSEGRLTSLERGTRMSFTFRKILHGECTCMYKTLCDSYHNKMKNGIKEDFAPELEKQHVYDVYENIASHFSSTRHKPWPEVLEFVLSFKDGSLLIDAGCGNGKYLGQNKSIFHIGCDTSSGLINVCKERGLEAFLGNCLNIPLKDNIADGAISIAVIHHLSTEDRRISAIKEIIRVLRVGGFALIYVWAKDQFKNEEKTSYIKQDRKHRKTNDIVPSDCSIEEKSVSNKITLPVHVNRTQFKHKDILVPWKLKGGNETEATFLRYYHVFEENELEHLCCKLCDVEIVKSYYDQGNCCVLLKKR